MTEDLPSRQPAYSYVAPPPVAPAQAPRRTVQPPAPRSSPAPGAGVVRAVALVSLAGNVIVGAGGALLAAADIAAGLGDPGWHALGAGLGITLGVLPAVVGLALLSGGFVHLRRTGRPAVLAALTLPASVVPALALLVVLSALVR